MARAINRLSARSVATTKAPGMHADGGGLYLKVTNAGSKQWVFIFRLNGKRCEMGLGGVLAVSLARAREKASEARAVVADGQNPILLKRAKAAVPTFGEIADEFIVTRSTGLRSEKSVARLKRVLSEKGYASTLRTKPVNLIDTEDVLEVLKPIWSTKAETATIARGYIEAVLSAAKAKGFRSGENPARWRGHLDHLLAARQRLARGHHAAMPYAHTPKFIAKLRERKASAALGLELLVLTAARSGEGPARTLSRDRRTGREGWSGIPAQQAWSQSRRVYLRSGRPEFLVEPEQRAERRHWSPGRTALTGK